MAYKGINVIDPATAQKPPYGWGAQEQQNWKDLIDCVTGDAVGGVIDKTGQKHSNLYDETGSALVECSAGNVTLPVNNANINGNVSIGIAGGSGSLTVHGDATVEGVLTLSSGIKIGDNSADASDDLVGTLRFRINPAGFSEYSLSGGGNATSALEICAKVHLAGGDPTQIYASWVLVQAW